MAKVSVLNVAVLENPSPFHSPFRFEISFECSEALADGELGPRGDASPLRERPSGLRIFPGRPLFPLPSDRATRPGGHTSILPGRCRILTRPKHLLPL